jgi:hypothetical protein
MRRLSAPVLLLLLPLAVFLALFQPATLDVGNAGWLIRGTDNGENALGLHAWLHDPAAGPAPRTALLNAPEGVPLLFTDSNPLVALAAKPLAALLPADAQFVGSWILLCLGLNALFAWLLLRRHAPGPLALWCGVALLAFPPTLANRFIHANLMAHWTILAALWLFLQPERARRLRWWAPLIAVTTLIHSYLLVMVGAIWASAMLRAGWQGGRRGAAAVAGQVAAILGIVIGLALWLGVGGDYAAAGNYGAFAMPLDALWNPGNASFSNVLPAIAQREGRGFEGFQYLGLGGLLLLAVAAFAWTRRPLLSEDRGIWPQLRWLLPALVALTLLAVSHMPDFAGQPVVRIALPDRVVELLDAVRASGRLFWPVAYTLLLVAILAVFHFGRRGAGQVLAALLLLQAADLTGMARAIRATSAEAGNYRLYARTPDPRWTALVAGAREVAFVPGDVTRDLALFQEVAWRAASAGKPVRTVYAARTSATTAQRLAAEQAAFARGERVPGRLYVLLPGVPVPADAVMIDGVAVIPASSPPAIS